MEIKIPVLNKYEIYFYLFIWSAAIFYSIYEVYTISNSFIRFNNIYTDFAPGWSWLKRNQDFSDQEWKTWIPLMNNLLLWTVVHHFVSHLIKYFYDSTLVCWWYISVSISYLCYHVGLQSMICVLAQLSVQCILTHNRSKSIIWLVHVLFLFIIHFLKIPDGIFQQWLELQDDEHYILTLTMCWIQLRNLSQSIDDTNDNNNEKQFYDWNNILKKFAYCLYLPTLSLGPLILYREFLAALDRPFQPWDFVWLKRLFSNLFRYIFWLYFTEFALHFLYFNAISYHPEVVRYLNPWALYGLGYCMGQYFLNKYVVIYGINGQLCEADGIQAPPQPKCIARIHLYSDMWKHFDRGLYKFLMRYIYIPSLTSNSYFSKMYASFLCFAFVFIWHGMQLHIFTWAFLNYFGLAIEELARNIARTKQYYLIQQRYLNARNTLRLNCILSSPLLAMSALSNFYFFAREEVGDIYVYRILHDSWDTLLILLFFLYCCCQVSTDIKRRETENCVSSKYEYSFSH